MIYWLNFNYVVGIQVKHLFLILSIFLLTSPLFCQETGVLYQYKISSGFVWKTFGKGKVQPKYEGEISTGIPEGFGILSYPFDDGKTAVGEWKDGKEWNSEGSINYYYGSKYVGEWKDGERNGQGIIKYRVGEQWQGEWKDDEYYGQGTYTHSNGIKYVGEWKDGTFIGKIKSEGNTDFWGSYNGKWTYYNADGSIDKVEEYKDGELVE